MRPARETDVAVIGAGPAGLSAAIAAAKSGVRVTVLDEYRQPGGQFYKQLPTEFKVEDSAQLPAGYNQGDEILARMRDAPIEILNDTLVWASFEAGSLSVRCKDAMEVIRFKSAVVATGAYERPAAFPGWDLPGVMTPGAAQTLVKTQLILPGKRIVLAGSGPFLMPVATTLAEAGANIVAIYEATTPREWAPHLPRLWGHWRRIGEAIGYWRAIRRSSIPVRFGHMVVRAEGNDVVERVVLMRCDRTGKLVPGTQITETADTLCVGHGFTPQVQLSRMLGCEHVYDAAKGGWVPVHDDSMQTSVPGVFVAGEAAGIGGAHAAMAEGTLAGLSAARWCGRPVGGREISEAARARARHRAFSRLVSDVFAIKPSVLDLITDDTIVCRCEEVTAREVRAAARLWGANVNYIKGVTRCGMGYCQGRVCGSLVEGLTARTLGLAASGVDHLHVRAPLKPVTVRDLASLAD